MTDAANLRPGLLGAFLAGLLSACAASGDGMSAATPAVAEAQATACERLAEYDANTLAVAQGRLAAELDAATEASRDLQAALDALPEGALPTAAVDAVASSRGRLLVALAGLMPEVAGAADDGARLQGWVAWVDDGVPLRFPAEPDQRAQALRLATLSTALALPMAGPARLANYFRRLDNLGGFIASARAGDKRGADAMRTAAFDLHGNFTELERRYRQVLRRRDAHWEPACRKPRTAMHKGMGGQ